MNTVKRCLSVQEFLQRVTQFIPSQATLTSLFEKIVVDPAGYTSLINRDRAIRSLLPKFAGLAIIEKKEGHVLPYLDRINPNDCYDGWPLIACAVDYDHPGAARALLEAGADPNTTYANRWKLKVGFNPTHKIKGELACTILSGALSNGDFDLAKTILKKGANPNQGNRFFSEPLSARSEITCDDLEEIVKEKEDPPIFIFVDNDEITASDEIAVLDDVEMVTAFLEAGVEVNVPSSKGETALQRAVRRNVFAVVAKLLEHGANFSVEGSREFLFCYEAAKNNNLEMLQLLMDHEIDPTLIGPNGESALAEAFKHRNSVMVDVLLEAGAVLSQNQKSFDEIFPETDRSGFIEILKMMVDNEKFKFPDIKVEERGIEVGVEHALLTLLAHIQLDWWNQEHDFQKLAQGLCKKGASIEEACRFLEGDSAIAQEWLRGAVRETGAGNNN